MEFDDEDILFEKAVENLFAAQDAIELNSNEEEVKKLVNTAIQEINQALAILEERKAAKALAQN